MKKLWLQKSDSREIIATEGNILKPNESETVRKCKCFLDKTDVPQLRLLYRNLKWFHILKKEQYLWYKLQLSYVSSAYKIQNE